jgi:hypothetical protein|eukprot:COSAG01_NODE_3092_length_6596_cov_28.917193_3_plen_106_part_00
MPEVSQLPASLGASQYLTTGPLCSFFELPATTPGAQPAEAGADVPTHVHKCSHGGKDWMQVGKYTPGKPKQLGSFVAAGSVPKVDKCIDTGDLCHHLSPWQAGLR